MRVISQVFGFALLLWGFSAGQSLNAVPGMQVKGSLKAPKSAEVEESNADKVPVIEEEYLYETDELELEPIQKRQRLHQSSRFQWLPEQASRRNYRPLSRMNNGHASPIHEWKGR